MACLYFGNNIKNANQGVGSNNIQSRVSPRLARELREKAKSAGLLVPR